jgi:hypothetical protein
MGDEITTRGYMTLTSTECTTTMIAKLAVISGLISSLDYMVLEMVWFWICFWLSCVKLCDL